MKKKIFIIGSGFSSLSAACYLSNEGFEVHVFEVAGFEMIGRPDDMQRDLEEGTLFNMSGLPIPRLGRPEDIANLTMFLASDVSGYITGQMISVSGGAYMH